MTSPMKKEHMFKNITLLISYTVLATALTFTNMPPNGFNNFKSNYFVETGPYAGYSINQALDAGFKVIHGIELDSRAAGSTTRNFKDKSNVHIWHGDSGAILYEVIKDIDDRITFWLNTNNPSMNLNIEHTAILRELDQIKRHHIKTHTILIDSIRDHGNRTFDFISLDSIIAKIKEINPDYHISFMTGGDFFESPNHILVAQAPEYKSSYLDPALINKIDKQEVNLVIQLGAFDGRDCIELHKHYRCPILGFECALDSIKKSREMIQQYPSIKLIEKAGWNASQLINFNYCPSHPENSSCFFFDYQTMANRDGETVPQMIKRYSTKSIKVEAVRLDEWLQDNNIHQVDMLCMSTQGSALPILEGLGSYLHTVKYVITQVEYQRVYKDQALFPEINHFMKQHGFTVFNAEPDGFFNYVIFVRNDLCR
jgi:FkbM family methyltransferase